MGAAVAHGPIFHYRRLFNWIFIIFIWTGIVSALKPSPYDFLALIVIPLWFIGGFRIHRAVVFILVLWCIFEIAGFAALMPYWDEADPRLFQLQSLYLFVTVVFFTLFFSERTIERAELCLKAYTVSSVFCALLGIASYFNVGGIGLLWSLDEGRAASTFDDPNLYGSYLTLAAVNVLYALLLGTTKRTLLSTVMLAILIVGIFVSYSRGSWGALVISSLLMGIAAYSTAGSHRRRRIALMSAVSVGIIGLSLFALLSQPAVRKFFLERAALAQTYDEGATGRFGNQIRALPMLLERPEGFGPLRFRDFFHLEPHNSYIGAFANDGWIGGFTWIIITVSTCFVGFRLMFVLSPYRRLAQIYWPALFSWLLQGLQIDIDHWRQLLLCFGVIWGMEAARVRWLSHKTRAVATPPLQSESELCPAGPMHLWRSPRSQEGSASWRPQLRHIASQIRIWRHRPIS